MHFLSIFLFSTYILFSSTGSALEVDRLYCQGGFNENTVTQFTDYFVIYATYDLKTGSIEIINKKRFKETMPDDDIGGDIVITVYNLNDEPVNIFQYESPATEILAEGLVIPKDSSVVPFHFFIPTLYLSHDFYITINNSSNNSTDSKSMLLGYLMNESSNSLTTVD